MLSTNSGYNMLNRYQWKCKIAFRDIFNSVFKVCKWGTQRTSVNEWLRAVKEGYTVVPGHES